MWIYLILFIIGILMIIPLETLISEEIEISRLEKKKEKDKLSYIEADEDEKISKEIDRFIEENNCYIPKK